MPEKESPEETAPDTPATVFDLLLEGVGGDPPDPMPDDPTDEQQASYNFKEAVRLLGVGIDSGGTLVSITIARQVQALLTAPLPSTLPAPQEAERAKGEPVGVSYGGSQHQGMRTSATPTAAKLPPAPASSAGAKKPEK